jgi:hypothetical protein
VTHSHRWPEAVDHLARASWNRAARPEFTLQVAQLREWDGGDQS